MFGLLWLILLRLLLQESEPVNLFEHKEEFVFSHAMKDLNEPHHGLAPETLPAPSFRITVPMQPCPNSVIFPFIGFLTNKPEVISKLEEGEEPWTVEEEFLYQNYPGELVSTGR